MKQSEIDAIIEYVEAAIARKYNGAEDIERFLMADQRLRQTLNKE